MIYSTQVEWLFLSLDLDDLSLNKLLAKTKRVKQRNAVSLLYLRYPLLKRHYSRNNLRYVYIFYLK